MKKWVVITGASSGIGQALAVFFSNVGCHVLAIGRNEVALQRTKLLAKPDHLAVVVADLSVQEEIEKVVKDLSAESKIEYLIHCAATTEPHSPLTTVTRSALERIINTNVMAPIFLTQKLAPYFNPNSRVLFIGSDYVGIDNKVRPHITGPYGISKSALRVAVEYFRHEYKNTALIGYLNSGSTDTPMFNAMKNAVVSKQGVFNNSGQPSHPNKVAEFIYAVLRRTSDQDYISVDWDYRVAAQRQQILTNEFTTSIPNIRSKL